MEFQALLFWRDPSLFIPFTPSVNKMRAICIRLTPPIYTPVKPFGIIAWLMFILNKLFVSIHTETLQKPYRKYTQIQARSYRYP